MRSRGSSQHNIRLKITLSNESRIGPDTKASELKAKGGGCGSARPGSQVALDPSSFPSCSCDRQRGPPDPSSSMSPLAQLRQRVRRLFGSRSTPCTAAHPSDLAAASSSSSPSPWHEYSSSQGQWQPITPSEGDGELRTLRIVSWNVDSGAPAAAVRLKALLDHVFSLQPPVDFILLQEVSFLVLPVLLDSQVIRTGFLLSNVSHTPWQDAYGTVTLARSSLKPFLGTLDRIALPTHYHRDALCADLRLSGSNSSTSSQADMSIINVHLDSLERGWNTRPRQLAVCTDRLRALPRGGVVAGDFNPINPEIDDRLAESMGLIDAWRAVHGEGKEEDGYTWGVQVEERFPANRMDRVVCLGVVPRGLEVVRCGQVEVETHEGKKTLFWSDHCGLLADFDLDPDART